MIKKKIIYEIQKKGSGISLEQFIHICLFDKGGYYSIANPLGKSGDFTTSPEISQLFGEIIGLYIFYIWQEKYKNKINLIELGPGNGTLLIDVLRITRKLSDFHNCLNIHLIEKNDYFIKKQKHNILINKFDKLNIKWHADLSSLKKKPSIIIGNEFFDCLPIRQFQKKNNKWHETIINFDNTEERFFYQNSIVIENYLLKKLSEYKTNNIAEISPKRESYFKKICEYISHSSGLIIIIDYGYFKFPGNFTLQSTSNHQPSNLLDNVGKQDITSLVDFKKLIQIAKNSNLNVNSFCSQKEFLLSNGILERKNKIMKTCTSKQKSIVETGYNRLIDEKQMGSVFKFLILSSKDLYEKK